MSSTKRTRLDRARITNAGCLCNKKLYPNKKKVQEIAKARTRRDGVPWNAYKCPFYSRMWHLGHATGTELRTREGQRTRIEADTERIARGRMEAHVRGGRRAAVGRGLISPNGP